MSLSAIFDPIVRAYFENLYGGSGGGGGPADEGWIGDGNTHLWISLPEGRTSPMLGVAASGTVTVDWGDGSAPDVLTGKGQNIAACTPNHEYASAGDYIITLTVDGKLYFNGSGSPDSDACLLRHSFEADKRNIVYRNAMKKIELGEGATSIGISAFNNCYGLASITISEGVTSIGASAFNNCYGIKFYDFSNHTAVPTLSATSPFSSIAADCEIRVPAALVDEWKAATNWSTYADYIVGV